MQSITLWIIAILVALLVVRAYSGKTIQDRTPESWRRLLTFLRLAFLLALVGLMAAPKIMREIERPRKAHLTILVDDSESMNLPDSSSEMNPPSRIDKVKGILKKEEISHFNEKHLSVSLWRMSDLSPISDIAKLSASAPATQIGRALSDLSLKYKDQAPEAIILLTDGQNTRGPAPEQIAGLIPCPIYPLGFGSTEAGWEVLIDELIVPRHAFLGEAVPLNAIIRQKGASSDQPLDVKIGLYSDNQLIQQEKVTLNSGQSRYEWRTEKVFDSLGSHHLEFRIEPNLPPSHIPTAEVRQAQWIHSTDLLILKNRYRVALLSGNPSWESKYVKRSLEEDPRLEVLLLWPKPDGEWAIIPSSRSRSESPDPELASLITALQQNPELDTLLDNLPKLDLLILSDLKNKDRKGRSPDLTPKRSSKITQWIKEQEGNLMVLGGKEMYGSGGKNFAGLAPLLPVQLKEGNDYRMQPIFPRLTQTGIRSYALATLQQTPLENLGPLESFHVLGSAKQGAEILLESEQENPLIAWHTYGDGRVMALAFRDSWVYGFPLAESKVPADFFGNFWREMVRFLVLGRHSGGTRLYTDGQQYQREEPVRIWAYLALNLSVESPQTQLPVTLIREGEDKPETLYLSQNPYSPTLYEGTFRPQQIGIYSLSIQQKSFKDEKKIEVITAQEEFERPNQNVDLLKELAKRSKGQYLQPGNFDQLPEILDYRPQMETLERPVFLGSLPWVLPLLLGLITIEWIIRKRLSLP